MSGRHPAVVLGSGNIGTDLLFKLQRSAVLEPVAVVGIDPASDGLERARRAGVVATADGPDWLADNAEPGTIVFDATSASAHIGHRARLIDAGFKLVDLTPAKVAPGVVPVVNGAGHEQTGEVSLISCGGQATIPIVAAVANVAPVAYAEVVATIASRSAGPGTRQNIDEFTSTTAAGVAEIGGAERAKAIILLNPAEPPIRMRNTVYCRLEAEGDQTRIEAAVIDMAARVAEYSPGYRVVLGPLFQDRVVTVTVEVEGAGDYLPTYAGNLDIMTAAAVRVGEDLVRG
jgi:acetaldehyde dehydrogenase (acetylating)